MIDLIRIIVPIFSPLCISLILLFAALGFLLNKKRMIAIGCLCFGIGILLFFGYGLITKGVLFRLERTYTPFSLEKIDPATRDRIQYVVVLGSGHVSNPLLPVTAQIGSDSLYRLVEGVRIIRELPGSKMVICGGRIPDPVPNAHVVAAVARQIGVEPHRILIEDRPRDTFEEARYLKKVLGDQPFVLVTSAVHMKRAIRLFDSLNMRPMPAPTNFIFKHNSKLSNSSWFPSCGNMSLSQTVIYEWLGGLWGKFKNRFVKSQ